jgi:hypothetical protein
MTVGSSINKILSKKEYMHAVCRYVQQDVPEEREGGY